MSNSRWGKILLVDLTKGEAKEENVPPEITEKYVGGKGLASWYLYSLTGKKIDPLEADNPVIFAGGPLTGTSAPAMRGCVVSTSPLTGGYVDSYYGGHFAQEIKYCGYDAIIITGKASELTNLVIDESGVKIQSAEKYQGLNTFETNHNLKEELGDETYRIACIGVAGEKMVPFSLVSCEYNRHAGRGGIGAVMGSKKLKAIALRGNKPLTVNDTDKFSEYVAKARTELKESAAVQELTECGTAASLWFANESGLLPVYNYQQGTFEPETLANEAQAREIWLRDTACNSCPIRCSKIGVIRKGKHRGTVSDIVEYETAALMGTNLGIKELEKVAYLVYLCDALGLDGMSCGSTIGFAMEAFSKGLLKPEECDGIKLEFGSAADVDKAITMLAERRGYLGELLSLGTAKAAEKLGEKAIDIAVHVKGMDVPAWGPRGIPGMALAYLTADRGACHQRAFPINYEVGGELFEGEALERLAIKGKARPVVRDQNYLAALDILVKCDFGSFGISPETYCSLYEAATGDELSMDRLMETGERIWNVSRLFNIRQGIISKESERLPRRFYKPLPDGPVAGHKFTREDEAVMLEEYYKLRGWDAEGIPTPETLNRLGIKKGDC